MTLTHRFRALLGAALLSALPLVAGTSTAFASTDPQTLTFGVAPGPYGDMVNLTIKPQLEKKCYKVVVREFSDYVQHNLALANGSIDANLFQHSLYLEKFAVDNGLKLEKLIIVPTASMGFYSKKKSTRWTS